MSQVSSKPQGERSRSPQGSGATVGYRKKGFPKQKPKNRLDHIKIEAKRQPPANPHLIRGLAGPPGPPRTISGLTQSGLGLERNHEASNEVLILRLARGPTSERS